MGCSEVIFAFKKALEERINHEYAEVALHVDELAKEAADDLVERGIHVLDFMKGYIKKTEDLESVRHYIDKLYGHMEADTKIEIKHLDAACSKCGRETLVCCYNMMQDEDNSLHIHRHDCLNPVCNHSDRSDSYGDDAGCDFCKKLDDL